MQMVLDRQYPWGKTSPPVKGFARLEKAMDQIRNALDTRFFAEISGLPTDTTLSPYYPAHRFLPDTICQAIKGHFWARPPRPRTLLSALQGDILLERLAVLGRPLDVITYLVLEGYGASQGVSESCQRLWRTGGLLSKIGLAIEREWLSRERHYWPTDAANAFLRRLDTLSHAVPLPPVWEEWFEVLDKPEVWVEGP
jgi:hypothetical protein